MQTKIAILLTFLSLTTVPLWSQTPDVGYANSHAPIGVMRDHNHKQGEWMFSYRFARMNMNTLYDGTDVVNDIEVRNNYAVSPTDMETDMHMVGIMYAPTNRLTLMTMIPRLEKRMQFYDAGGNKFGRSATGLGDISLNAIYHAHSWGNTKLLLNAGVSLPTGDIDQIVNGQKLPYPMQLGSGTWDLLPGITLLRQGDKWSWGAQANMRIHLGTNSNDYRLGDRYQITSWLSYLWSKAFSNSIRLDWQKWDNIEGADPDLNPAMVPTADVYNQGGERLNLLFGLNYLHQSGFLKGHRLSIEFGFPLYQNLDGPQLGTDWILTAGWQYAF